MPLMTFKRGKRNLIADYGMEDVYKHYKKVTGNPYNLTQREFTKVLSEVFGEVWEKIIYNNYDFKIPIGFGSLYIKTYQHNFKLEENGDLCTKNLPIDWIETKKLWMEDPEARKNKKLLYLFNDHSDGRKARIWWDRFNTTVPNLQKYMFVPSRQHKREVAKAMKSRKVTYYEFT